MKKEKFYKPEIHEIVTGLELFSKDPSSGSYAKHVIKSPMDIHDTLGFKCDAEGYVIKDPISDCIYAKHLDKADIESLGFDCKILGKKWMAECCGQFGEFYITLRTWADNQITISKRWDAKKDALGGSLTIDCFAGTIKNKRELTQILEMIGVNLSLNTKHDE